MNDEVYRAYFYQYLVYHTKPEPFRLYMDCYDILSIKNKLAKYKKLDLVNMYHFQVTASESMTAMVDLLSGWVSWVKLYHLYSVRVRVPQRIAESSRYHDSHCYYVTSVLYRLPLDGHCRYPLSLCVTCHSSRHCVTCHSSRHCVTCHSSRHGVTCPSNTQHC